MSRSNFARSEPSRSASAKYIEPVPSTTANVQDPSFELPSIATKTRETNAPFQNMTRSPSLSQNTPIPKLNYLNSNKPAKYTENLNSSDSNSAVSVADDIFFLAQKGYTEIITMRNTLQGELFCAKSSERNCEVIIKKTEKHLHQEKISVQDGINIVVEENIVKEALILKHLTVDNQSGNDYIVRFIDFFDSNDAYYLVMEHAGNMTLALFIQKAHALIAENKMKHKHFKRIVKWIFWQLVVVIHWLHNDMNCCHLDLRLENIMILNGGFVENKEEKGTFCINPNISIKVIDFGLADVFRGSINDKLHGFECCKYGITTNCHLNAPRVIAGDLYDARKADVWSLGIILYELATGLQPYTSITDRDYRRIEKKKIKQLITFREKAKYVNNKMLALLSELLNTEESERIHSHTILENEWLSSYYQKYKNHIKRKSKLQLRRNKSLEKKMNTFPYYTH